MNLADAFVTSGVLALLISVPIGGLLAAWSGKGALWALSLLATLFAANVFLGSFVNYDDAVYFVFALPLLNLFMIAIGRCVGAIARAVRSSSAGARKSIG